MSNPTTPFSWQMPTATDLVTDLPADFEVFGQAVATSMADLLGGTTGQVLSKTTNADMDFTWINNDQGDITGVTAGTGISGGGTSGTVTVTNSMATAIDAKGDLIGGTGADTFARLGVGANGTVLTADSAEATGLKWATAGGGGKVLQVIQATSATQVNVSTTTFTDTGLSVTITPSSATSRVMIIATHAGSGKDTGNTSATFRLMRGATSIGTFAPIVGVTGSTATDISNVTISYVDSPATTSATTYKTQLNSSDNIAKAFTGAGAGTSTIIAMEIGA
jgi:hypothetical protein